MNTRPDACTVAVANVRHGINADRRFPKNVFAGDWNDFLFFDSDWMFDVEFVEHVKAFLNAEDGTCACLKNLDSAATGEGAEDSFLVDRQTTRGDYQSLLSGESPGTGWVFDFGRFGCASDKGLWCMYCERANEIAVIAFRHSSVVERYALPTAQFRAVRLTEAVAEPLSYGFSERALSVAWRNELLREYASGPL